RPICWNVRGNRNRCGLRHVEQRLMRMQREDRAHAKVRRTELDHTDRRITVLDGKRERTGHEGSTHPLEFRDRNTSIGNERFGSAADRSMGCTHPYHAGHQRAQLLVAEFCATGINVPECSTSFVDCGLAHWLGAMSSQTSSSRRSYFF